MVYQWKGSTGPSIREEELGQALNALRQKLKETTQQLAEAQRTNQALEENLTKTRARAAKKEALLRADQEAARTARQKLRAEAVAHATTLKAEAHERATTILEQAHQQAAAIITAAENKATLIRELAYDQGRALSERDYSNRHNRKRDQLADHRKAKTAVLKHFQESRAA